MSDRAPEIYLLSPQAPTSIDPLLSQKAKVGGLGEYIENVSPYISKKFPKTKIIAQYRADLQLPEMENFNGVSIVRPHNGIDLSDGEKRRIVKEELIGVEDVLPLGILEYSLYVGTEIKIGDSTIILDNQDWWALYSTEIIRKKASRQNKNNIKSIFHVHSLQPDRSDKTLYQNGKIIFTNPYEGSQAIRDAECHLGFGKSNLIIFVSNLVKDEAKEYYSYHLNTSERGRAYKTIDENSVVCYNGVNTEEFSPNKVSSSDKQRIKDMYGIKDDEEYLLWISRLNRVKGAEQLVMAAPYIKSKHPNVKILMFGGMGNSRDEIDFMNYISDKIKNLNIEDTVILHNSYLTLPDKLAIISGSKFCIANMKFGPFELWPLEAGALRKACVVGVGGFPLECTVDGITSLWTKRRSIENIHIDPNDPISLAETIDYALNNPELIEKIESNIHELIAKHFSWKDRVKPILKSYELVASGEIQELKEEMEYENQKIIDFAHQLEN